MRSKRLQDIVDYVNLERSVSFSALCQHFNTSPATMRRDLKMLGDSGQIERVHGGARSLHARHAEEDYHYPQRMVRHVAEKQSIARRALEEIRDREAVILDSSTTVCELARLLAASSLRISVITNDIVICTILQNHPTVELINVGGIIRTGSSHGTGVFAEYVLKQMHADRVFLGVDALDAERGGFVFHVDEVKCKRLMVQQTRSCIVLCDHTKFFDSGLVPVCSIGDISKIITDKGLDDEVAEGFAAHEHLELIRA